MSAEIVTKSPELEVQEPAVSPVIHHDSEEYESAEEVEEASFEEEVEEVEVEVEEVEEEEEEAGEQEVEKDKEVDEDRKNPQFIPKKGYFYEHDDRTAGVEEGPEEEEEEPVKVEKPKPIKTARDPGRWTHDLFDEEEQAPKTRAELSGRYGYDIRSEDQAPRARRRRRYGRGPTKYTRKWEEEEAYQKPRGGGPRGRGGRGSGGGPRQGTRAEFDEEFPELPSQSREQTTEAEAESRGPRKENYYQAERDGNDNERGGRGGGGRGRGSSARGRGGGPDRERQDDVRGRGGGRGWGRRNEFSNRNRYPDRRGSNEKDYAAAASGVKKEERVEKPKETYYQAAKPEDARRVGDKVTPEKNLATATNTNTNNTAKKSAGRVPPPFTNTEYKGSESLATVNTKPQQNVNERTIPPRQEQNEPNYNEDLDNSGSGRDGDAFPRDGRGYGQDRRAQIPPRLQQQQQQQQPLDAAPKPKRFSTQRQRQNVDPSKPLVTAAGVVSGAGPGPSPVSTISSYPPSQGYYDTAVPSTFEGRAYPGPGSGTSVAVSGSGHGPTVTPSLWVPHSSPYVTAPYPSPPTGPQVPQPPYQDPPYMPPQQGGPPIFAPPPHPQFIQDPTIINYVPPVPPPNYGPSFHASGFQGYAQVAPPPPPELYHAGVTYYSTQNQIPRPHIPAVSKRPKQVLQLVEPPEKKDIGGHYRGGGGKGQHRYEPDYSGYHEGAPGPGPGRQGQDSEGVPPAPSSTSTPLTGASASASAAPKRTDAELADQLETMKLQPEPERVKKSPSPAPLDLGEKSWSEQMADITPVNSPTEPEGADRTLTSDSSRESRKADSNNDDSKETKAKEE